MLRNILALFLVFHCSSMLRQIINLQQQHLAILLVLLLNPLLASAGDNNQDMFEAAMAGNNARVKQLLRKGWDVNTRFEDGFTALMFAAGSGHTETTKILIDSGADVNARFEDGFTALMLAAEKGHAEIVRILNNAGADVNAKNKAGGTALMVAAAQGHTEIVEILKQAGARE